MFPQLLLPPGADLRIDSLEGDEIRITLTLSTSQPSAVCPDCRTPSHRVHSRYPRTVADLPWAGRAVKLVLRVRRFFCDNLTCARRTFAESLHPGIARYARRTLRLQVQLQHLGLALGGEAGARLGAQSGCPSSPDTLLRVIRRLPLPHRPTPQVLGVDDWAFRKRTRYGTILVDLEAGHVVDLLPERSSAALAAWLQAHPGVTIVSRDRSELYAEGIRQGAPNAIQVADRWHLAKNLGDALQVHNPAHVEHGFRCMSSTRSGPCRAAIPVAWRPLFRGRRNRRSA